MYGVHEITQKKFRVYVFRMSRFSRRVVKISASKTSRCGRSVSDVYLVSDIYYYNSFSNGEDRIIKLKSDVFIHNYRITIHLLEPPTYLRSFGTLAKIEQSKDNKTSKQKFEVNITCS